jgi:hypothetical protein
MIGKGSEFKNNGNNTTTICGHHGRPSMVHSRVVIHPFQLPTGWNLSRLNNTCNNIFKARLSILILSKT